MVQAVAEIPEANAEGQIKTTYDDIKATLRVPLVNLVFRVLATQPDYLVLAWRALKPNAQTIYFEECADRMRSRAVELAEANGQAPRPQNADEVGAVVSVFHYINPKLLLAVAALRGATLGLQPKLTELSRDAKRQIAPGIPAGTPEIAMVDPEQADAPTSEIFADIKSSLGISVVNSDYRALARWPEYLQSAWQAWRPKVGQPEYRQMEGELRRMAEDAVTAFPFRMDLHPHALRHAGLSEAQIDSLQGTLRQFYGLLPGLVGATAFFAAGALGSEQARQTPYPATLL